MTQEVTTDDFTNYGWIEIVVSVLSNIPFEN